MKLTKLSAIGGTVLFATLLSPAFANHRTGDDPLPEAMVAGDFNQDGNLDLAVDVSGFDNIAILLGDGQGGFTPAGHFATNTVPKGLAAGDVNGDGHVDLVNCTIWGYNEAVLLGDGLGAFHFASPPDDITGDGEPNRLLLADFNKDGRLDIAVNSPDGDSLLLYLGDGRGNFPEPAASETGGVNNPFGMATADLNHDTNLDIALVSVSMSAGRSNVDVLLGDGTGAFTIVANLPVNDLPTDLKIGDLNNDGNLDLVVSGAVPHNKTGKFLSTYLGDGAGNFTRKQTLLLGTGSTQGEICLGDFNEDGNLDVAFPQETNSKVVLIFFGDGAGNFTAGPVLTTGASPHSAIAVDVNKDGHLDLAVSNRVDGTVTVLLGDGAGNFTISSTTPVAGFFSGN